MTRLPASRMPAPAFPSLSNMSRRETLLDILLKLSRITNWLLETMAAILQRPESDRKNHERRAKPGQFRALQWWAGGTDGANTFSGRTGCGRFGGSQRRKCRLNPGTV